MFIILMAHTPGNAWTLWIPARFGFSDATEIFVFCSGFASARAFGPVFLQAGWWLGTARILQRVWQVYWAQIGMVLVTVGFLLAVDRYGLGTQGVRYVALLPLEPLFERTDAALLGLLTLTWVPNFFDILPMYIVILALVPGVMLIAGRFGPGAVAVVVITAWAVAQTGALDLPSRPWAPEIPWFFNPFGWQLVFFTGFAFGMGWLKAPPVRAALVRLAALYVLLVVPFAWHQIHDGGWLPADWALREWIAGVRASIEPLWWKTEVGALRYLHFLALAYLAWVAVGPGGVRLTTGVRAPRAAGPALLAVCALVALLTLPYAWIEEIAALSPRLDAAVLRLLEAGAAGGGVSLVAPPVLVGPLQVLHLVALTVLGWAALGEARRRALCTAGVARVVPVVRKVGTQSLAVFMVSILLAQVNGWLLDLMGRDMLTWMAVNLWGCAVLVFTAYLVSWFKSQPWRRPGAGRAEAPSGAGAGAVGRVHFVD
ncbi:OpgC family protein [Paroceanicella profunda]|nr:OpgC domain-containing protein [Paroceanicella profunda]